MNNFFTRLVRHTQGTLPSLHPIARLATEPTAAPEPAPRIDGEPAAFGADELAPSMQTDAPPSRRGASAARPSYAEVVTVAPQAAKDVERAVRSSPRDEDAEAAPARAEPPVPSPLPQFTESPVTGPSGRSRSAPTATEAPVGVRVEEPIAELAHEVARTGATQPGARAEAGATAAGAPLEAAARWVTARELLATHAAASTSRSADLPFAPGLPPRPGPIGNGRFTPLAAERAPSARRERTSPLPRPTSQRPSPLGSSAASTRFTLAPEEGAQADVPTSIAVHIGRIEVHGSTESGPKASPAPKGKLPRPRVDLARYAEQRATGRRS